MLKLNPSLKNCLFYAYNIDKIQGKVFKNLNFDPFSLFREITYIGGFFTLF
jgi:hypothetical protein